MTGHAVTVLVGVVVLIAASIPTPSAPPFALFPAPSGLRAARRAAGANSKADGSPVTF
jgi:hypothetical protein